MLAMRIKKTSSKVFKKDNNYIKMMGLSLLTLIVVLKIIANCINQQINQIS